MSSNVAQSTTSNAQLAANLGNVVVALEQQRRDMEQLRREQHARRVAKLSLIVNDTNKPLLDRQAAQAAIIEEKNRLRRLELAREQLADAAMDVQGNDEEGLDPE